MSDLLAFTHRSQSRPPKAGADARRQDFNEIYALFDRMTASEQASRCSQCGIPFCQVHCPLSNNIPDWLMLAASGRLREAYELSAATNNFPEICGRICPQDRLCEGSCVIEPGFGSVTIGQIEQFITETAFAEGWVQPLPVGPANGMSVGIIGAGPAGLAAAEGLCAEGYNVHVYDRHDRIGGLMIYGIPNFKLDKSVIQRRAERMQAANIQFHLNCEIGRDVSFSELRAQHAALLIATGVYQPHQLNLPSIPSSGVVAALDYLTASSRVGLGDTVPAYADGTLNMRDKRVVVIGGGDTAMDCVRTAVRQGAASVTCLYRRDRDNMPGSAREVKHAEEEGVVFEWLSAPASFIGIDRVEAVEVQAMALGAPDRYGRLSPVTIEGSTRRLPADCVITALGFTLEDLPTQFKEPQLKRTAQGNLWMDSKQMLTSLNGVFVAGDAARGASLVVWAIRDGRDAAAAIHRYCMAQSSHIANTQPHKAAQA